MEILSIDFEILTSDFYSAECPFDAHFSVYDVFLLEIYVFLLCYVFFTIIKREVNVEWALRPSVLRQKVLTDLTFLVRFLRVPECFEKITCCHQGTPVEMKLDEQRKNDGAETFQEKKTGLTLFMRKK